MHLHNIELTMPELLADAYMDLQNTPFYQVGDIYKFAEHTLFSVETPTPLAELLNDELALGRDEQLGQRITLVLREGIDTLSSLELTSDDLNAWTMFRKEQGTVIKYHNVLESIYQGLLLVLFEAQVMTPPKDNDHPSDTDGDYDASCRYLYYQNDYLKTHKVTPDDTISKTSQGGAVLNKNNPFADVSIQDQQYIHPSDYGQFEVLALNTSKTFTRVQKDEDKSYLVLQPGFKIKKTSQIDQDANPDILFDDTTTTKLSQQDNHVYVYID